MKERWADHQKHQRALVGLRVARVGGRCEACGQAPATEWAHLAGRRHLIAEPWCSSAELTAALCRECHRALDGNRTPAVLATLRWDAIERLMARLPGPIEPVLGHPRDPMGVIRQIVDALVAMQVQP